MQKIAPQTAAVRDNDQSQPTVSFDRPLHASLGRLTAGVSPAALGLAWADWVQHLLFSPDKQLELANEALRAWASLVAFCQRGSLAWEDAPEQALPDKRFAGPGWQRWPFNAAPQGFLLAQDLWQTATIGVHGVSGHHEDVVSFVARQLLSMASPANFLLTNPEVLEATVRQGCMNLVRGSINLIEDWRRATSGKRPWGPKPLRSVATWQ